MSLSMSMNILTSKQNIPNETNVTSQIATMKKELSEYKIKCNQYDKISLKSNHKVNEMTKDYHQLKTLYDTQSKELSIMKLTNDKILAERLIKENQLEQNKVYITKLENKLCEITKAKNHSILDQNIKLKRECEELHKENTEIKQSFNLLESQINEYKREIKILHQALEVKTDNLRYKDNIKSSLFYDVGIIKQELDDMKIQVDDLKKDNEKLKNENDKKRNILQDISFNKTNLIEEIAELKCLNEKKDNDLLIKDKQIKELSNEKQSINKEFEKLKGAVFKIRKADKYNINTDYNSNFNKKTHYNSRFTTQSKLSPFNSQPSERKEDVLKVSMLDMPIEQLIIEHRKEIEVFEMKFSKINNKYQEIQVTNTKLKQINDDLLRQVNIIEKENNDLMNTKQLLSKQNDELVHEVNITKKDIGGNLEMKEEEVNQLSSLINNLRNEVQGYKKEIKDYSIQCDSLTGLNDQMKAENHTLKLQLEKIKTTNYLLHQNIANAMQSSESIINSTDNLTPIQMGTVKVSETSMISLIKKEKEKNKEYNDLINQYKKQAN